VVAGAFAGYPAASRAAAATTAAAARALYEQAQDLLATRSSADLERSLDLFLEAARVDPRHARAHAGAATAASLLALYSVAPPRPLFAIARREAATALRLDPQLPPARAAKGLLEYLDDWDARAAETSLREALRLDPGYAPAWHWYGMMLMATRRFDESIAAFDRAIAVEPETSLFHAKRAGVLAVAGRLDEAEADLRRVVERFPRSGLAHRELGYVLIERGRVAEGVTSLRRAAQLTGGEEENADLGWGLARAGERPAAEAIAARLVAAEKEEFVSPLDLATVYAGLDRRDDAFEWLARAIEIHDPGLVYLATAPAWVPIREDPRFTGLVERIGLAGRAIDTDSTAERKDERR
jgi:tetratricopeptide (TPR) repeat protein